MKYNVYVERVGDKNSRQPVGEFATETELNKFVYNFANNQGYSAKYCGHWLGENGEHYIDYGSWGSYLVVIEE